MLMDLGQRASPPPSRRRDTSVITGTGFHAEEKQVVIDLCKRLGVRYHGDLVCGTTTHLVCKSVLGAVNTAKYLKAMEWGVQVVAAQWLTDSAAANRLLPCTDYKTDPRRPLPLTSVTPAWPTTPPSPPRAAAVHPGKENHRPAAQIAATGPTIAATAAPKKSPSQPDAQHGHSKGSTRQLLLALQPGTSSAAAQPGHMSRQACSLSPEQHQEQPKSPRPSLHDAAQSHASKQNGAEPPSQRPQDFSFGTGPPPPAQCLDPQPAREGLQGRLDAAGRGHEHAVSLNRWLQHSARAPPPECPGTPRILPGPRTPPPPQSAPQPPSRGLPAGMPDMDLSEIEGHMRLREAPAAQGSAGLGGLEWGGSPWGALRARSVAKDEAGARVSVPPSPSEAWNADDLVIPGTQAEFDSEDDLMSTPTSLVTYLRRKEEAAAAAAPPPHPPPPPHTPNGATALFLPCSTAAVAPACHTPAAVKGHSSTALRAPASGRRPTPHRPTVHALPHARPCPTTCNTHAASLGGHALWGTLQQQQQQQQRSPVPLPLPLQPSAAHEPQAWAGPGRCGSHGDNEADMMVLSPEPARKPEPHPARSPPGAGAGGAGGGAAAPAGGGSPAVGATVQGPGGGWEGGDLNGGSAAAWCGGGAGASGALLAGQEEAQSMGGAGSPMAVSPLHPSAGPSMRAVGGRCGRWAAQERAEEEEDNEEEKDNKEEEEGEEGVPLKDAMVTSPLPPPPPPARCSDGCGVGAEQQQQQQYLAAQRDGSAGQPGRPQATSPFHGPFAAGSLGEQLRVAATEAAVPPSSSSAGATRHGASSCCDAAARGSQGSGSRYPPSASHVTVRRSRAAALQAGAEEEEEEVQDQAGVRGGGKGEAVGLALEEGPSPMEEGLEEAEGEGVGVGEGHGSSGGASYAPWVPWEISPGGTRCARQPGGTSMGGSSGGEGERSRGGPAKGEGGGGGGSEGALSSAGGGASSSGSGPASSGSGCLSDVPSAHLVARAGVAIGEHAPAVRLAHALPRADRCHTLRPAPQALAQPCASPPRQPHREDARAPASQQQPHPLQWPSAAASPAPSPPAAPPAACAGGHGRGPMQSPGQGGGGGAPVQGGPGGQQQGDVAGVQLHPHIHGRSHAQPGTGPLTAEAHMEALGQEGRELTPPPPQPQQQPQQQDNAGGSCWLDVGQELQEALQLLARQPPPQPRAVQVVVLKGLKGSPRGTTAKEYHRLSSLRSLTFAEQVEVQVPGQSIVLTCKDKAKRTTCAVICPGAGSPGPCVAEPFAAYQTPDGSWWLEYHRLHRLQAAEALAAAGGKVLSIPCGFAAGHELLRDTEREHCRLSSVLGSVTVSRSKRVAFDLGKQRCMLPRADLRADEAAGGMHLLRVRLLCLAQLRVHQRFTFDSRLLCVLTDSSASPLLQ